MSVLCVYGFDHLSANRDGTDPKYEFDELGLATILPWYRDPNDTDEIQETGILLNCDTVEQRTIMWNNLRGHLSYVAPKVTNVTGKCCFEVLCQLPPNPATPIIQIAFNVAFQVTLPGIYSLFGAVTEVEAQQVPWYPVQLDGTFTVYHVAAEYNSITKSVTYWVNGEKQTVPNPRAPRAHFCILDLSFWNTVNSYNEESWVGIRDIVIKGYDADSTEADRVPNVKQVVKSYLPSSINASTWLNTEILLGRLQFHIAQLTAVGKETSQPLEAKFIDNVTEAPSNVQGLSILVERIEPSVKGFAETDLKVLPADVKCLNLTIGSASEHWFNMATIDPDRDKVTLDASFLTNMLAQLGVNSLKKK